MIRLVTLLGLLAGTSMLAAAGVHFDAAGNAVVDGKPFFPIGIFTYSVDGAVMAEVKRQGFNTILAFTADHRPEQLDFFRREGMMTVAPARTNWLAAAPAHPGLLAWYLEDEPEGHKLTPEAMRRRYLEVKALDPHHPIGLCHFLWEALADYTNAVDFTMTSTYPVTANYDTPITHVGLFIDRARSLHSPGWPHWPFIQVFGGPDTDGGRWRQPAGVEVRCMVYLALVHRANGILYFSYWPKARDTWAAVGVLNREIRQLSPWLLAPGTELASTNAPAAVQVRVKQTAPDGQSGLLLWVNSSPNAVAARITVPALSQRKLPLRDLEGRRSGRLEHGTWTERLAPLQTGAFVWGREPKPPDGLPAGR
jgi:hypothetical protein